MLPLRDGIDRDPGWAMLIKGGTDRLHISDNGWPQVEVHVFTLKTCASIR